uniref:Uncharacterized protein n=1 Tax=Ostreococcus sp. 'lucimarinus' TaxID=242159 RepID=A0A7R9T639_9CHLO|mmetsp:Transcript_7279/g.29296  ORF Transcript_7279/g.29296 Transcript_7279/m.29296 type:complete len:128 (+) Transcript_7279:156-539(+)
MASVSGALHRVPKLSPRNLAPGSREASKNVAGRQSVVANIFKKNKEPDWDAMERRPRTVSEEIGRRQFANRRANNGKDRKDLYTDNWDGSEYKGSSFNILSLVAALFVLVPLGLLIFAYTSYGTLWG